MDGAGAEAWCSPRLLAERAWRVAWGCSRPAPASPTTPASACTPAAPPPSSPAARRWRADTLAQPRSACRQILLACGGSKRESRKRGSSVPRRLATAAMLCALVAPLWAAPPAAAQRGYDEAEIRALFDGLRNGTMPSEIGRAHV